mgnify:CR=1 FL=1
MGRCTDCRYHKAEGATFFGICTYFGLNGKEDKNIEDPNIYDNGCNLFRETMKCFECGEKTDYNSSSPASANPNDDDRCCNICYEKIIKDTITEFKDMKNGLQPIL